MRTTKLTFKTFLLISLITLLGQTAASQTTRNRQAQGSTGRGTLWRNPGNISARDLLYGPGAPSMAPVAPFTYIEEDKSGESPKFRVRDAFGVEWSVKLGPEAQAETVATRLVWAVGYFAEEAYYFDEINVEGLSKLSRGQQYVFGSIVRGARFEPKRSGMKRGSTWDWQNNPFRNTREMSGLKVLMILLNNYDAHSGNNRIIHADGEARYYVTDLGATLGRAGGLGGTRSKNDLADFLSTKFVRGVDARDGVVEFDYDTRPTGIGHLSVLHPIYYRSQVNKEKAMRGIPVAHARWIGALLRQLSDEQLRDAFRAANYAEGTREGYVRALRERINQLNQLPTARRASPRSERSIGTKVGEVNSKAVDAVETGVSKAVKGVRSAIRW